MSPEQLVSSRNMAPEVHEHPTSGITVLPILTELLPFPLPLLKRIQFHHRSPASRILATFPATSEHIVHDTRDSIPKCFAVAFLDRTRRPETECWLFLSGEILGRCALSSSSKRCVECQEALIAVIKALRASDVPESIHDEAALIEANPHMARALRGEVLLIGSLNEACYNILQATMPEVIIPPPIRGIDEGWIKYIFRPSALPESAQLADGFRWGSVQPKDFELVRNRTSIPRTDATLSLLPSLAVFRSDEVDSPPVAWAFLGPDGSLTSLHTEIECRGRGLAKLLVAKLFGGSNFSPRTQRASDDVSKPGVDGSASWFHADTGVDNASSRAVCRALGGTEGWLVYWTRIDTNKRGSFHQTHRACGDTE